MLGHPGVEGRPIDAGQAHVGDDHIIVSFLKLLNRRVAAGHDVVFAHAAALLPTGTALVAEGVSVLFPDERARWRASAKPLGVSNSARHSSLKPRNGYRVVVQQGSQLKRRLVG